MYQQGTGTGINTKPPRKIQTATPEHSYLPKPIDMSKFDVVKDDSDLQTNPHGEHLNS